MNDDERRKKLERELDPGEQMNRALRGFTGRQPAEPKDQSEAKEPKDQKDETLSEQMNRLLRKGNQ